jgi:hypothetical protein
MDPQTVRELNNELTDLNTAVRQTDETFLDVLGPMAAQIKEKLAKENKQAALDQDNVTNSLENSYSKTRQLADKQQALYQQQLQRRGYDIDQSGREVKTSKELSINQKALLERLDKTIAKEHALIQATDKPVEQFRALAGSVNSIGGIFEKLQDKMFEMTGKSVGGAIALQAGIAAVTGITKSFGVMAEAIHNGERGASVGAKGAREFSDAVTKAAYGIAAALLILPLGPVLKIAGVALAAAAAAMEVSTKLTEMGAKLNDDLYKSYGQLSEKGLTTAKGMSGLYDTLHKVGLSAGEIEKFNKLLGDNSKDLALFGGTAAKGVSRFETVASAISAPTSELNKQFLLMGINSDAQREHIMKYMTEEERLGLAEGRSKEQQIVGATKYIENLDKLSMITGTNRKELEEARATVMANENLRAAIFAAEQDRSEAGQARLAELKRAFEASAMLQAAGDTKGATGVAEYFAGRGITGQASAVAYNQFAGKGGLIEGIKKGASTGELSTRAASGYERQAAMMADTGRFGGDTSGMMTSGFGQAQEYTARMAELQKKAAELGYTNVSDYINAEQEAKKNTKDKTTQKNAEVAQLQQETAMILDGAAKAMDGAGLAMASAMKVFNESVELFGDATKKMAKEKGISVPESSTQQSADLKKEVAKLKESIRIKNQSIENLDPKLESNKAYIDRMKSELEVMNKDLLNTEQKLTIITKEQKEKEASPANLPPGATIPTPPGPPSKDAIPPSAANMPIPDMSVPTPGPGVKVASATPSLPKTTESLFTFGSKSGSKSNFEALSEGIKNRIISAAKEFNSMTGSKIAINSAKRDSEDQQRLWDESVKAGRPGISPTGMPIGKPGTSKHERGLAVDIQNYNDPAAVAAMNKQGLFQTVPKDPVHFEAAKTGAMFSGPSDGYFVQLHGKEFVGNEDQLDAIKKLLDKVEETGMLSDGAGAGSEYYNDDSATIIEKFTVMLESKADELLDKIKFGNRVDTDLLNYSQG